MKKEQRCLFQEQMSLLMGKYLSQKANEFYKKSKKEKLDLSNYFDKLKSAKNFNEVRSICKDLIKMGVDSLISPLASLTKFYTYTSEHAVHISEIDDLFMQNFSENLELAPSTKWLYVENIIEFLTSVENSSSKFKLNISYADIRLKKPNTKEYEYDVLTYDEMCHFSNVLETIKFKNDFEKYRAILICRIMLYSGITSKELAGLQLGKNLIVSGDDIYLELENREVKIFLPSEKIIEPLNHYCTLKENNTSGLLFYPITDPNKVLSNPQVNELVKSMLSKAKIKKSILNATLLRVSFAVFLYNYRVNNMQYHISAIQKILGHTRREHTEKMIGFFSKDYTDTKSLFR